MSKSSKKVILQLLPELYAGGVERGTIDMARAITQQNMQAIVASSGGPLTSELEGIGARHITLPLDQKGPFAIARNAKTIEAIIKEYQVDIVHARSRAPAWSGYLASKRTQASFLTTFHGTHRMKGPGKRYYNSVMAKGERVIAVSEFIAEHIQQEYAVDAQKIRVIHRGVDMDYFDPAHVSEQRILAIKEQWGVSSKQKVIFLPGRITRWKGQAVLLEALKQMEDLTGICVIMAGDVGKHPQFYQELEQEIARHNWQPHVKIVEAVRDMPAAYMASDIVISASQRPEAFGRIAVEGQAMQKPTIVTHIGGAQETVIDGETGFGVAAGDGAALMRAIEEVLTMSDEKLSRLGKKTRDHIGEYFSLEKMCDKTLCVYEELLR